jgi:ribonuclease I
MLFTTMQLVAKNAHRVPASRMKRVEDLHLKTQMPGIMTLARAALVKHTWRSHSDCWQRIGVGRSGSRPLPI